MTQFESELKSRIKEFRPWYWWICKISFLYILMFSGLIFSLIQGAKSLFSKLQGKKVAELPSLNLNEWYVIIALAFIIGALVLYTR